MNESGKLSWLIGEFVYTNLATFQYFKVTIQWFNFSVSKPKILFATKKIIWNFTAISQHKLHMSHDTKGKNTFVKENENKLV